MNTLPEAKKLSELESKVAKTVLEERNVIISRFPLPFALLGAFGLVSVFYGFEHIIDEVPFLVNNPLLLLLVGIVCLGVTGRFYKKLD